MATREMAFYEGLTATLVVNTFEMKRFTLRREERGGGQDRKDLMTSHSLCSALHCTAFAPRLRVSASPRELAKPRQLAITFGWVPWLRDRLGITK